jgi:DNA-binding MarR family transcriptional regulator
MTCAMAKISPLDAHLGYWLRFVSNHVSQGFARKVAARGVTVAEWVVLRELYDDAHMPPSVLAGNLGMTRGAISKLADRLAAKGLLAQTSDGEDRRYLALSLTSKGRALVPKVAALADANDAAFFACLNAGEREALEKMMKKIARHHAFKSTPIA